MNIRFPRYLSVAFLFIFTSIAAYCAGVTIHGKVTDQNSKPVEFATVRIKGTALGVTTGLEGDYRIQTPARDTLVIVFSCIGYNEESRTLSGPKGDLTIN
ncbi:MAG: carboxypeptidase-like regulatory domain-containing protein, partial [Paramuribaculum sp.]|nr:carboxypeptidase-like regulatory domain-containing protein [Paramuribaculum sp.]